MLPEIKKPITNLDEMTCENCVFSDTTGDIVCNNPNSDNWHRNNGEFCSEGQWLWLGTWDSIMDDKPKLHLFRFDELYEMFAREAHLTRNMRHNKHDIP